MDSILLAIHPKDAPWIVIAFICGFLVTRVGLPPLVGFLFAGFFLHGLGAESVDFLALTADMGITLLLFTIGLKLKVKNLLKAEVWASASIHMILTTLGIFAFILLLTVTGFKTLSDISFSTALIIGFALSFSSTVFAVKILDELGAGATSHGELSIGILIIQDIAAVGFLAVSAAKWPTPWAVLLLLLIPMRTLIAKLMEKSGHGELLTLFGIALAIGGADLFELVDLKGDLGALVVGMLLAGSEKANELAKRLLGFKELFLVGFFLSVGLTAPPGLQEVAIALLILLLLPMKTFLYFFVLTRFQVQVRTAWQSALNLANFSEFGLIVGAIAASKGFMSEDWLSVFAILLALSFIISAPLATAGDKFYQRYKHILYRFDRYQPPPEELEAVAPATNILIFGMGRVGTAIYNSFDVKKVYVVTGIEADGEYAHQLCKLGKHVVWGDATDPEFWDLNDELLRGLKWVVLALPTHAANLHAAQQVQRLGYRGRIAATTRHIDESEVLKQEGVNYIFDLHGEAGRGVAQDLMLQDGIS